MSSQLTKVGVYELVYLGYMTRKEFLKLTPFVIHSFPYSVLIQAPELATTMEQVLYEVEKHGFDAESLVDSFHAKGVYSSLYSRLPERQLSDHHHYVAFAWS